MKKLYYSAIILLVAIIALVMPKVKAAGEFDDTAHYIGVIDGYETEVINGYEYIVGAWVYIVDSSLPKGDYSIYYLFSLDYFQPDLIVLADEMIGKTLIWNMFDDRASGGDYTGAWWLLVGYEYISDDIADAYQYGYESGYNNGFNAGEQVGYENGYNTGYDEGYDDGWDTGYEDGYWAAYDFAYDEGYDDGWDDRAEYADEGTFDEGYSKGYNDGRVAVQRENKSLLSVIPTTIGAVWLMISDFLSFEVFGINLWAIIIVFASFSLLVLIIKMVI